VVDEGAVGRAQIGDVRGAVATGDARVTARDVVEVDADVIGLVPADGEVIAFDDELLAHLRTADLAQPRPDALGHLRVELFDAGDAGLVRRHESTASPIAPPQVARDGHCWGTMLPKDPPRAHPINGRKSAAGPLCSSVRPGAESLRA